MVHYKQIIHIGNAISEIVDKKQVERRGYLQFLEMFRDDTRLIKVITGVRRCGKSTLLDQFIKKLLDSSVKEEEILRMNLESSEFMALETAAALAENVYARVPRQGRFYIFLDEIQRVEGWEKTVNSLLVDTEADIYITGSNSHLLSTELSTYLTGRYVSVQMLPLSFAEYKELRGAGRNDQELFRDYLEYGGFPLVDPSLGKTAVTSILQDLYNSIIFQDVVSRGNIRNTGELLRLVSYMMFNIGNISSLRKITEGLGDVHRNTVEKYLGLLEEACVLYRADRFDLRSTALNPLPKYYAVDPGLRNIAAGFSSADRGRVLENVVYLELLRRGYQVTVGKWDAQEVDFVASRPMAGKEYYQVCYGFLQESTEERELAPLQAIKDNFPKTVLTMDPWGSSTTRDGILIRNVVEWLLAGDEK